MTDEHTIPVTPAELTALGSVLLGLGVWIHLAARSQLAALLLDGLLLALVTAGYFVGTAYALRDWKHRTVLRARRDPSAPRPDLPALHTMRIRLLTTTAAFAVTAAACIACRIVTDERHLTGPLAVGLLLGVVFAYVGTFHVMRPADRRP